MTSIKNRGAVYETDAESQVEDVNAEPEQENEVAEPSDNVIFGLFISLSHMIKDDYNKKHKELHSKIEKQGFVLVLSQPSPLSVLDSK